MDPSFPSGLLCRVNSLWAGSGEEPWWGFMWGPPSQFSVPLGSTKHHQENLGEKYQETQVILRVTDAWGLSSTVSHQRLTWDLTIQALPEDSSHVHGTAVIWHSQRNTVWTSGHNGGTSGSEVRVQGALTNGTGQRQRDSQYCGKAWMSEDFRRWLGITLPALQASTLCHLSGLSSLPVPKVNATYFRFLLYRIPSLKPISVSAICCSKKKKIKTTKQINNYLNLVAYTTMLYYLSWFYKQFFCFAWCNWVS